MLTGKLTPEVMGHDRDFRKYLPRTSGDGYNANMALVKALKKIAELKGITLSQLALAWILSKGDDIVPIPGTRNIRYLMDNINATKVQLDDKDIKEIETITYPGAVIGERYTPEGMKGVNC